MKKIGFVLSLILVVSMFLVACTPTPVDTPAPAAPTDAPATAVPPTAVPPTEVPAVVEPTNAPDLAMDAPALKITGMVQSEMAWSEDEVKALPTLEVEAKNSKDELSKYTGVLISDLLALVSPKAEATTLVLIADDGFEAEVPLADVLACTNCILSFRDKGGFSSVLPDFAKNLQVKGVVEMQVK